TVHDDLVPGLIGEAAQVGMAHERPVELPAQEKALAPRDDEQAAIRQPIDAKWKAKRSADYDLPVAIKIDCHDLLSAPVREPKTILVPTGRFTHREPGQQGSHFRLPAILHRIPPR